MLNNSKEYQLSLFDNGWTDNTVRKPSDGQPILYYYLIENSEDTFTDHHQLYKGKMMVGPLYKIYRKKDKSIYRPIAYWIEVKPLDTELITKKCEHKEVIPT